MSFFGNLITQVKTSAQEIANSLVNEIKNFFRGKIPDSKQSNKNNEITRRLRAEVVKQIRETKEFKSLVNNGNLNMELGLPRENRKWLFQSLPHIVASCVSIAGETNNKTYTIKVALTNSPIFKVIRFDNGLSEYTYDSKTLDKRVTIPWFKWLVDSSGKQFGYPATVSASLHRGSLPGKESRSGKAIMISEKDKMWGWLYTFPWKLSSQWRGDIQDNFITRAIDKAISAVNLERILKEEINK